MFFLATIDSKAQDTNYVTFIAKNGDSVYKILQQNGLTEISCFEKFVELNANLLGKNNTLIMGRTYKLPEQLPLQQDTIKEIEPSKTRIKPKKPTIQPDTLKEVQSENLPVKMITEPLFGKALEHVDIIDQQLRGAAFYLVSGHGGPDPGAMGKIGNNILCEDEYAYDVTLRFGREIIKHGGKVYFIVRDPHDGIRDELFLKNSKDEVCYPDKAIPLNQIERLKQRVEAINTLNRNETPGSFKRYIEIHVDSRATKKNIDIFFYYNPGSKLGERLATTMRNSIERKYQLRQPGRGYSGDVGTRRLYMLEKTIPTAVFIELGNINHVRDQQRLIFENNRQAIARWLCDGVIEDFQKSK